ncbi:MAG: TonB-dependent receptor, partial [Deltaproteobacteria bacterium]|nr:TonB-dependent receptor [Deltaproteobacteria bacterium]
RVNATFFYEDIKDMQLQFNDPGFNVILANAGDAYVYGAEVEGAFRPIAGLDITAGFGYTHERLDEAINPTNGIDEKSNRHFEYSPTYNWNASVRYAFPPLQVGNLVGRVDYRGSSAVGFNSSISDDKIVGQSSYGVFDARLALNDMGVDWIGGTFDLALIGRNLADKSYKNGGYTFGVDPVYRWATNTYGDPRTYAAEVTWRWGSQQ